MGVGSAGLELLERVIKRRCVIRRGERLFSRGSRFHSVYAVKSGSMKTSLPLDARCAQVTGFHLPGELIGLDAVGPGLYQYDACALETSSLCEVPFDKLEELGLLMHGVQRQMMRIATGQIQQALLLQVLHCRKSAEQRLAGFLVNLSTRFEGRGFSASEFRLSMSRADIASYLGLAKATVCRQFTAFQDQQLVSIDHKDLRIQDRDRLEGIAGMKAGEFLPWRAGTNPRQR
ncbi:MAG: helix-turn-helix domain-containing protein [Burkholderiaceae bacterium]|nr:helix-turn-helix domain-containing protein [Burkholderiaceae bacterium]